MNPRSRVWFSVVAFASALVGAAALTAGEAGRNLKYQFKPGETYVYAVTIVGELGSATQTSKGTIQLTGKAADNNELRLTPSVSIATTVRQPASPGKKGIKSGPGGPFGKGPLGPKFFTGPRELTIDPFGKLVKTSGETSLPLLLGTAEEFVIEPLSAQGEKRWQLDKTLFIREGERASVGPPRNVNETNTSAKETVTYEIAGATGNVVTIKKTYDLKTTAQDGASRIQFDGAGEIHFDTQAGLIKSGEFKGTIVVTEKNVTFRIPVTASYRLMDAAEAAALKKQQDENREKAIQAAKERAAPQPAGEADIQKALADLKSGNKTAMRTAADRLAKSAPSAGLRTAGLREEVATQLAAAMTDNSLRFQAGKALKVWGTDKTVTPLLKSPDQFVRLEACRILAEVGTSASLPALQAAQSDTSRLVANEAGKAAKAVEGRKSVPK